MVTFSRLRSAFVLVSLSLTLDRSPDDMSTWDEAKLREVVSRKGNPKATTDIVCKHFLAAVETGKYGWFWECPEGGDKCKYRHALPPGFVLKSQKKKEEEDAKNQEISLEEFLEVEVSLLIYLFHSLCRYTLQTLPGYYSLLTLFRFFSLCYSVTSSTRPS